MSIDAIILELARRQHGLVTTSQLAACGVSRDVVRRRVRSGLLACLYAGVYQVGPVAPRHARERGALLACRSGVISHTSAAAMLQLVPARTHHEPVHLTLPIGIPGGRMRRGLRVHRARLAAPDIMIFEECRITTPVRTLLDLAGILAAPDLERALARAERADPSFRERLAREPRLRTRCRGMPQLRMLLQDHAPFVRSEAEAALVALLRRSGLPLPETNVVLHGIEVDCLWRRQGLVVEVDGFTYHGARSARRRDRDRDAMLLAAGFRVMRLGASQVGNEPERVVALLAQALARAP